MSISCLVLGQQYLFGSVSLIWGAEALPNAKYARQTESRSLLRTSWNKSLQNIHKSLHSNASKSAPYPYHRRHRLDLSHEPFPAALEGVHKIIKQGQKINVKNTELISSWKISMNKLVALPLLPYCLRVDLMIGFGATLFARFSVNDLGCGSIAQCKIRTANRKSKSS